MDKNLKQKLHECSKDMYRCLTMMDAGLLMNSAETYLRHLMLLRQKLEECEKQIKNATKN